MKLNNIYSAIVKSLKGQSITAEINEMLNIDRLKTMYYGYEGDREIEIRFIDPRRFTAEQRRFVFALLRDIYDYTGQPVDDLKAIFYLMFEAETGRQISLSDESTTTVDDVTQLANIIIDFIFLNNIPFKNGYDILPANQEYYFYKCVTNRVCCICGKTRADIDHYDQALGRRSRNKVDHSDYTFAALCREHHTIKHQMGLTAFKRKYRVIGVKLNKETIKRLGIGG